MNEIQKLETRMRSITEELRSRRSSSEKQADFAIRADARRDPDAEIEDEVSPASNDHGAQSSSERQA
ncbi:hypothetical protein, partial [Burkholderia sp. SIMBA_024]|uniref:hypothetical protein n=1 Tax=Burkholderia sp. SIMBA_024 TaxID=3085768 RepID=UPI00397BFFBC